MLKLQKSFQKGKKIQRYQGWNEESSKFKSPKLDLGLLNLNLMIEPLLLQEPTGIKYAFQNAQIWRVRIVHLDGYKKKLVGTFSEFY